MAKDFAKLYAKEFSKNKQIVEAKLAQQLYRLFNQGPALEKLQRLARRCAKKMVFGKDEWFNGAATEEDKLRVWSKIGAHTKEDMTRLFASSRFRNLDASDVSDMIRLFGSWVEHGGTVGSFVEGGHDAWESDKNQNIPNFTKTYEVKEAYRAGVPGNKGAWNKSEVEAVWGDKKKKGKFENVPVARRDRGKGRPIEEHIIKYMRDPTAFSGMAGMPSNPGIGKRATKDSNVLKLDRIFGLITGADISGTTTDTIFAVETLGSDYLTKAYYMLPLATIVHNNHHALIEVALALCNNGVLDYHIGFYDTLLPKGTGVVPSELEGVEEVLDDADRDFRNRYFVVYYDDRGNVAGCIVMSRSEAWDLRYKMCFQATRLLRKAPSLPLCPNREMVLSLFEGNLKIN